MRTNNTRLKRKSSTCLCTFNFIYTHIVERRHNEIRRIQTHPAESLHNLLNAFITYTLTVFMIWNAFNLYQMENHRIVDIKLQLLARANRFMIG